MIKRIKHKPDGDWEVSRGFYLPTMKRDEDAQRVARILQSVDGVNKVITNITSQHLTVLYDVTQTGFSIIEKELGNADFTPRENWWSRFRRSWHQFTENNMRDYAKAPKGACCNKPPTRTKQ